jgi:hypothetical protein
LDVPEAVRQELAFHLVDDIGEVLDHALAATKPTPQAAHPAKTTAW